MKRRTCPTCPTVFGFHCELSMSLAALDTCIVNHRGFSLKRTVERWPDVELAQQIKISPRIRLSGNKII